MTAPSPTLLERLSHRLGPKGWTTDPDALAPYLVEWRGRYRGATPFLAMPATTEETADVVRLCAQAGVAITTQGGNTGLVGGQIPDGEILLSLKRMNRIRSVDPLDDAITVEAGCVLEAVHAAAREAGRVFPLSLGSQGSATIGGLLSTNAGGVHVLRFGMMRDLALGLEVVLADGSVLPGLSALRKNNTGYDLKQLFIGAEGTLGVITAATLKLFPHPQEHVVAMAGLMEPRAGLELLHRLKAETGALVAFELMNRLSVDLAIKHCGARDPFAMAPTYLALLEFEGSGLDGGLEEAVETTLSAAIEEGLLVDAAVARSEAQARDYWRLRELIPAAHRPEGAQINLDISVPVSAVPAYLEETRALMEAICPGARLVAFGHAGDGNIHTTVMQPVAGDPKDFPGEALVDAIQRRASAMGGSISAEHGVGVSRRDELAGYKDPVALGLMKSMKAALDPKRILNPRAMLQD